MAGDEMMRGVGDGLPVPEFEAAAWATPKRCSRSRARALEPKL